MRIINLPPQWPVVHVFVVSPACQNTPEREFPLGGRVYHVAIHPPHTPSYKCCIHVEHIFEMTYFHTFRLYTCTCMININFILLYRLFYIVLYKVVHHSRNRLHFHKNNISRKRQRCNITGIMTYN